MAGIERGLYETLITELLAGRLADLPEGLSPQREDLRSAEAADRVAWHLARLVERALGSVTEKDRPVEAVRLVRRVLETIQAEIPDAELTQEALVEPARVLRAIHARRPDGLPESIPAPLTPLFDTALLTNAPDEPRVGSQLATEIESADRIDVVMAFIRRSGISPFLPALRRHVEAGRVLRVLTTTYTGSTEAKALDALAAAGAQIRVSYDLTSTRLHAKAWLFHRRTAFSTAYIGSSNLTYSAQVSGLEWNVRVSGARNPDVVGKFSSVFESYWNSGDFVPYDPAEFAARAAETASGEPRLLLSPIHLRLEPFQARMLEQIEAAREQGHHRNLLVSATGTGKTVMAALDYVTLRERLPRARLLFVAHREEILEQALATFRYAVQDAAFGERWVAGHRPSRFEHVFASIQSLRANGLEHLDPAHFDVVVVDEFHHAAAPSYRALLEHLRPLELLGLTATPERSDGLPLLGWFDDRIAAELRLWDAIDQHRLCPFLYFGVADGLDLREIPWKRGRGYDLERLSALLTANGAWAGLVLREVQARVDDPHRMRALGFCVSVAHARFMAEVFTSAGVAAVAVWADSSEAERRSALRELAEGRVQVVFSVDLFNEGIDVPVVDTVLFLRPTDSPTLFLQQLGRGLRRSAGKTACTVLDFVGQHRREFRFDRRFRALLGGTRRGLLRQIAQGFPFLPAGCHMELDPVAREIVLANVRDAIPSAWKGKADELRQVAKARGEVSLAEFLEESGYELEDVYERDARTWSDLREAAGLPVLPAGPRERVLRRACGRLRHVDDAGRIEAWRRWLASPSAIQAHQGSVREQRLLRMLVASVADQELSKGATLEEALELLVAHPQVCAELLALLEVLQGRVDHLHPRWDAGGDVPLEVHARYTRIEVLAALGVGEGAKVAPWQSGVYWAAEANADLLAFTLDKTSGHFSPTTSYKDRAISRELIHWESQSSTRADGPTGRRYREHVALGSRVLLFARLRADDRAFWFLGPATYVSHESELPMEITWRLRHPLPGDLYAAFAAAVA